MELNEKELYKLKTIKLVISKDITQKQAALKLEISDRQIRRLIEKYKNEGEKSLIHGNRGKESNKKISEKIKTEIVNTYLKEYSDYNFTHFYEECGKKYGISQTLMYEIFQEQEIISPQARHKTVKLYNENMKKAIEEKTITANQKKLYNQRKEEQEMHIRKSTINYSFGQEIQMDAAYWIWFGKYESALHLAVDKATKKVLGGWFNYEETTWAYLIILKKVIVNYGIPNKIKTDKRNTFSVNNIRSRKTKLNITQFGRICEELEIQLTCSSDPLFKPNVERENGTFKRRLKAELRHEGITTIEEANKYLNEVFIPKMNERFSYEINPQKNMMIKNIYTEEEIDIIISLREERTIDNASSLKYFSNYYIPIDMETGEVMTFKSCTRCNVINSINGKLYGEINNKIYLLHLIETPQKECTSSINGYTTIPKSNHPWRKKAVLK